MSRRLLIDPEQYPYGIKPDPDREYSEIMAACSACSQAEHELPGHSQCWLEGIPLGWESASDPILTDSGWKQLISRRIPRLDRKVKEVPLESDKWEKLLGMVEALPVLTYTEDSTVYYHQTVDRGPRGKDAFYFVYDTGDRIFSPAKGVIYIRIPF